MKKVKLVIFLYLVISSFTSKGQLNYEQNFLLYTNEIQELLFHNYTPQLIIKATDSIYKDAEFPEQLVQSILSATNQEWVDSYTYGGAEKSSKKSEEHFDRIQFMNKDSNYFELHHKLVFNIGSVPTAIIKFFLFQENEKPVSGAFLMQKINGVWYKSSDPNANDLVILTMRLKSEVLAGILLNNSENEDVLDLRQKVLTDENIDLVKLVSEFSSWYSPTRDEEKIELFIDSKTW